MEKDEIIATIKSRRLLRLKALIKKEIFQIVRDPSSILISVVLPIFLLFLYGSGVSLDLDHLRLGLILEDSDPDVQSLAESFSNSHYFDLKMAYDRRILAEDLMRGTIRGFVVVPSYFSEFRHREDKVAPIQVIADGSETNTAAFVQNYARGAFFNWLQQEAISSDLKGLPLVQSESRVWYNEELESRNFLLTGSMAIIMTLIGTLLTALVVAREWERGTMEAIMSTTVGIWELVVAKLIPYFILGMVSMVICFITAVFIYGVPFRGSLLLLTLVSAIFLFCALGLGLMISTLSKNQVLAYQISIITGFLPAYILSGFIFEISSMPDWVRILTYAIPAKYLVKCLLALFLVGNVWGLIFLNLLPMIGIGTIFFIITSLKTVKRLD